MTGHSTHATTGTLDRATMATDPRVGLHGSAALMPMELLGTSAGVTVIDPSTVLTRLWYFDGKFLTAEGFRRDQDYVRSLVALSNQAVGTGVVHGFDVRLASGDSFAIGSGLALALSGRVVYLPTRTDVSIRKLIDRATGSFDPGTAVASGTADFTVCPPERVGPDVEPITPRPFYVLTVAAAEALCGEEERFGKLCSDACATDTDRSVAVEGVVFRVHEIRLTLPASKAVPFTAMHLRSRVASSYFRRERDAVPSTISGAGLRSPVWCVGADAIGGEEVPLALFDRAGSVTSFVDEWSARRELVETTPQRYWQWRLAMRPLDVFLAQLLQFQCQLIDLGGAGPGVGEDPCAEPRRALQEVESVLEALALDVKTVPAAPGLAAAALKHPIGEAIAARLGALRTMVTGALSGAFARSSSSLLIDGGIIELPPGGYLPVTPGADIERQVRAFMGNGVDLRFCTVRADYVPEALQEAQHMERISLTQGLDDPSLREEVDVLVPGGSFAPIRSSVAAYEGVVSVLPGRGADDQGSSDVAALAMKSVARSHTDEGWSWSIAAFGEAPQRLNMEALARFVLRAAGIPVPSDANEELNVAFKKTADLFAAIDGSSLLRLNREASLARIRNERVAEAVAAGNAGFVHDAAVEADAKRPVAAWFDVSTVADLESVPIGSSTGLRLRATFYSRASRSEVLLDAQVQGKVTVLNRQPVPSGGGAPARTVISTRVDGVADPLLVLGGQEEDAAATPFSDFGLTWLLTQKQDGSRLLAVIPSQRGSRLGGFSETTADQRHIEGFVGAIVNFQAVGLAAWRPVLNAASGRELSKLVDGSLDEQLGALEPGANGRILGDAVIDVIAAELNARQRENGFAEEARRRLYGGTAATGSSVTSPSGWVMFHRRRTKNCGDAQVVRPVSVRRFRWYHAVIDRADGLAGPINAVRGEFKPVDGAQNLFARVRPGLDRFHFEPVGSVEFNEGAIDLTSPVAALRTSWSSAERGQSLRVAVLATEGPGEGAAIKLGRVRSATAVIGDLIDISALSASTLESIPPEFQGSGADGVIVTIGLARPVTVKSQAHVFRLRPDLFQAVMGELAALVHIDKIRDFVRERDGRDPVIARYEDDKIVNETEVANWWAQGRAKKIVVAPDADVLGDPVLAERWKGPRSAAIAELVGLAFPSEFRDDAQLDLGDSEAIVLILES